MNGCQTNFYTSKRECLTSPNSFYKTVVPFSLSRLRAVRMSDFLVHMRHITTARAAQGHFARMKRTPQEIYKATEPATRAPTKVLYRGRTASIGKRNEIAMRRTAEEA